MHVSPSVSSQDVAGDVPQSRSWHGVGVGVGWEPFGQSCKRPWKQTVFLEAQAEERVGVGASLHTFTQHCPLELRGGGGKEGMFCCYWR